MERVFKLLPDQPDDRDFLFKTVRSSRTLDKPPIQYSLRNTMPPVFEQGNIGSCTSNSFLAVVMSLIYAEKGQMPNSLSRLDHYWYARDERGNTEVDAGASLRDGAKVLLNRGVPREVDWPYVTANYKIKPPAEADVHAAEYKISEYSRITDLNGLIVSIGIGNPVVLGIQIFESFMTNLAASSGIIPMPNRDTEMRFGSHAVVAVGYNDVMGTIECRNSWGAEWGDEGYFNLPYAFIRDMSLTNDMWAVSIAKMEAYEQISFEQALILIHNSGKLPDFTPEFWEGLCNKFLSDPIKYDDFRFVELLIRKFAAAMRL